jgi:hypothetical protein
MKTDLQLVEAELSRLPGVVVARVLDHGENRPATATFFVSGGIPIDRLAGYAKSVASVHFDLDLDANRVVIIDISDLASAGSHSGGAMPRVAGSGAGDSGHEDSLQALQAAQRSAETLLERLTSRTGDAATSGAQGEWSASTAPTTETAKTAPK